MGELAPWPEIEPGPLVSEVWSLSHWNTREPPSFIFLMSGVLKTIFHVFCHCQHFKGREIRHNLLQGRTSPGGSDDKASAYNAGDPGSIPGLGRSPGEGNGNPLQYSCLENPMDGGALQLQRVGHDWATSLSLSCREGHQRICRHVIKLPYFSFFTFINLTMIYLGCVSCFVWLFFFSPCLFAYST